MFGIETHLSVLASEKIQYLVWMFGCDVVPFFLCLARCSCCAIVLWCWLHVFSSQSIALSFSSFFMKTMSFKDYWQGFLKRGSKWKKFCKFFLNGGQNEKRAWFRKTLLSFVSFSKTGVKMKKGHSLEKLLLVFLFLSFSFLFWHPTPR